MMDERRKKRGLVLAVLTVFCLVCAVWRPQLLSLLWQSVLDVAAPPFWGAALAFLLAPLYNALAHWWKDTPAARGAALLLSYALFFGVLTGLVLLLAPQLAQSIAALGEHSPEYAANLQLLLQKLESKLSLPDPLLAYQQDLCGKLFDTGAQALQKLFPRLIDLTQNILKTVLQMVLGLFFSVYLLSGGKTLSEQALFTLRTWLPKVRVDALVDFLTLCKRILYGWLTGQLLDCLILSVACCLGMVIFHFPYPVLIGLLVGLFNLIPVVGGCLGGLVSFLLLLAVQPLQAVWFMVYYLILQQLEGRFLYPRIVGSRLGLPPILVLFSVLCGGELGGFFGILTALPIAAVLYAAARSATHARHAANN